MTDPGPALTLGRMLDRAAERFPDREAVVFRGERVTYRDLKRRADDFARGLLALGLGPGDHVVLRDGHSYKQEQAEVMRRDWFQFRVPTTGTFRKVWQLARREW